MAHAWYDHWLERKHKYAKADDLFLDADRFSAIAVGIGLPNLVQKSTFSFRNVKDGADRFLGTSKSGERPFARIYTRLGNPTSEYLEKVLFRLDCQHIIDRALAADERKPTIGSLVTSSGMAAIACVTFAMLRSGDEILSGNVYGCTDSFFRSLERFGIHTHFVDTTDLEAVRATLVTHPKIAMAFLESPDNPTLSITDIRGVAALTEPRGIPLVIDNTFATPYLQQPMRLGADVVIQSLTKYVNGHSTSIAGCVIGPFEFMQDHLFPVYKDHGPTPSPFDSWLNSQGVQTLPVRIEAQCATAANLAKWLEKQPRVAHVFYPGLESHPQHALAKRQMRLPGAMISFELDGGFEPAQRLMNYFASYTTPMELAVSLGCVISYIQHPASMTHSGVPEADRHARGITDGLVRLSVGLEGYSVLQHALADGIERAFA